MWVLSAGALFQALLRWRSFNILYDHVISLAIAVNYHENGRLTLINASAANLALRSYETNTHWPPAMSVVLAFLISVFRDALIAAVVSDMLGLALLYSALGLLVKRLSPALPTAATVCMAVTLGFSGPPILAWFTNVWALGLYLWGILLLLPTPTGRFPSKGRCAVAGILLGLTFAFRYAYLPAALMPVLVIGWTERSSVVGRGRFSFALMGLSIGLLPMAVWHFLHPGGGGAATGWYFGNLLRFYSFLIDAFFGIRLSNLYPSSHFYFRSSVDPLLYGVRLLSSLCLLSAALVGARQLIRRSPDAAHRALWKQFFLLGGAAGMGTVALLVYLAVRTPADVALSGWVYVEEPRYFMVFLPFLLVAMASLAFSPVTGLLQRTLQLLSRAGFGVAVLVWGTSLPSELGAIGRGHWIPSVETCLVDEKGLAAVIRDIRRLGEVNAFVEIGERNINSLLRKAVVNCFGVAHIVLGADQPIQTSADVNVIAFLDPASSAAAAAAFERFCRENEAQRFAYGDRQLCRATLWAGGS